jgi:hypothetical protein
LNLGPRLSSLEAQDGLHGGTGPEDHGRPFRARMGGPAWCEAGGCEVGPSS